MDSSTSPASNSTERFRDMKLAAGRFIVRTRLGGGSFGDIYGGVDTWRNKDVAIKLEQVRARFPQLQYESKVYRLIHQNTLSVIGFPELHWFGVEGDYNVMVIDLCGPSIEDLFNYCHRKFSLKTICLLADQFLHRLEFLHSKQLIHRDIKPENFVMGLADRGHHVYLIDFGLSKRFWDARTSQHIPYKEGKPLTGTARYCSINTHLGIEQSRRDDLESIGHLLVYLHKGHLPWQGIRVPDPSQKTVRIGEKKISIGLDFLCRDEPPQMLKFLRYCRGLKFEETPDYEWCRSLFRDIAEKEGAQRDWVFDWVERRRRELAAAQQQQQLAVDGSVLGGASTSRSVSNNNNNNNPQVTVSAAAGGGGGVTNPMAGQPPTTAGGGGGDKSVSLMNTASSVNGAQAGTQASSRRL